MINGFALNHDKRLQIYFFYVKCQAKNNFLNDVESTVTTLFSGPAYCSTQLTSFVHILSPELTTALFESAEGRK